MSQFVQRVLNVFLSTFQSLYFILNQTFSISSLLILPSSQFSICFWYRFWVVCMQFIERCTRTNRVVQLIKEARNRNDIYIQWYVLHCSITLTSSFKGKPFRWHEPSQLLTWKFWLPLEELKAKIAHSKDWFTIFEKPFFSALHLLFQRLKLPKTDWAPRFLPAS